MAKGRGKKHMQKNLRNKRLNAVLTKLSLLLLVLSLLISLASCDSSSGVSSSPKGNNGGKNNVKYDENGDIVNDENLGNDNDSSGELTSGNKAEYEKSAVGQKLFKQRSSDFEIYFFDVDNIVNEDGTKFTPIKDLTSDFARPAECYMIVCGTTEILVDGGFQTNSSWDIIEKNCNNNLLPKIASLISEDGILDYLIVTHADYDHIASLAVSNGILDAFINQTEVTPLNGKDAVKLNYIKNIIDFDSNLIREHSDPELTSEANLFLSSRPYQMYCEKRDSAIEKGKEIDETVSYIPAATFFDNNEAISWESKEVATPDDILSKPAGALVNIRTPSYLKDKFDLNEEAPLGKLVAVESTNIYEKKDEEESDPPEDINTRYYYEIALSETVQLRILYSWYYDHLFYHNFDEKDRNNVSVSFQVVSKNFKFLSLGDLGGSGENGLLKYYDGTDVLKNINCYKASHHASISNGENSQRLFEVTTPQLIVITGVAWSKNSGVTNPSSPELKAEFFERIPSDSYVLCTNILSNDKYLRSVPFYGDIYVQARGTKTKFAYSYVGEIEACFTDAKNNTFRTADDGKLTLKDTVWYKEIFPSKNNEGEQ